jgi:predicted transport protein
MKKDNIALIVSEDRKYQFYSFKSEKELEDIASKHTKDIFGDDTIYLDIKKKVTSAEGISGIPDGFLIDFKKEKFYIIEFELSTHDVVGHISNQVTRFRIAVNNISTRENLAKEFHNKIVTDKLKQNVSLTNIQNIIKKPFGIVIIIDDISGRLTEVVDDQSQEGREVIAVPFETYIDSKNNYLYKFTTLTREALEKEAKKWTFKWTTIPVKNHLGKTENGNLKKVYDSLSKQILLLPEAKEKSRKNWVTYQTSPLKNFCTVKFFPEFLEIHLKCNGSFDDKKCVTRKIKRTPAWTFDRVFTINQKSDVEYAMHLIRQSYECTCCK